MPEMNDPADELLMQAMGGQGGQQTPTPQGMPAPQSQAPPQPNQFEQYLQSIIDQQKNYTRDSVYKDNVKQYYEDLGIKNPNSKSGKVAAMLHEIGLSVQANNNRPIGQRNTYNNYVGPTERLRAASDKEFKEQSPLMKAQLQELFKTGRNESTVGEKAYAENVRAGTANNRTAMLGEIASGKATIARLELAVKQGIAGADIALKTAKTRQTDLQDKILEDTYKDKLLSPQMRDAMHLEDERAKRGDQGDTYVNNLLGTMSDEANMKAPPSMNKNIATNDTPTWDRSMERYRAMQEANKLGKSPSSGIQIVQTTVPDGKGGVQPGIARVDKNTGQVSPVDFGTAGGPRNPDQQKLENNAKQVEANADVAWGTMINLFQNGKEKTVTGPGQGNPFSVWARKEGYPVPKGATEAELQQFVSNTALTHTRAMVNSGRLPIQVLQPIERMISSQASAADTMVNSLGAVVYSARIIRAVNSGVQPDELTPIVTQQFAEEIEKALRSAKADGIMKKQNPNYTLRNIKMPSIREIIDRVKQGTVPQAQGAAVGRGGTSQDDTIKQQIRKQLGLANAQ